MAFSAEDIVPDSPTNNFCTLNALYEGEGGGSGTLSEGNLKWATTSGHRRAVANIAHGSKFYVEYVCNANGGPNNVHMLGFVQISNPTGTVNSMDLYFNNYTNGSHTNRVNGSNTTVVVPAEYVYTGDVIGLCIDPETGYGWYSINGDWKQNGNPSTGTNPVFVNIPSKDWTVYNYNANNTGTYNFGQDPTFAGSKSPSTTYTDANGIGAFYYQPPTGALALCTANLPDFTPTVVNDTPQDYFKTVLYTGQTADSTFVDNGDNTWSKTGVGFQPDLIWAKSRSAATSHALADSVRGPRKILSSNSTADEYSETSGKTLLSFDSDGFTVGIDGNYTAFTASGSSIVAWCFRAGGPPSGSTSTTGSAKRINTSGTQDDTSCSALATAATNAGASNVITPTLMSINQAAGFSIVKYTGTGDVASVPHGLSSAPEVILAKDLDATQQWHCGFTEIGWGSHIHLDLPNAPTGSSAWNSTAPASFFFLLGGNSGTNANGNDFIAYCWHSVEGYSKFGSYTGNGSPDGPFVYCGFRPAFVMVKNTSSTGSWTIKDTSRDTFNPSGYTLLADTADDDFGPGNTNIDILSNGWKCRSSSTYINTTNNNYIFMAFAEQPFKYANAR